MFKKNKLTVRPLEVTTKAILEDVPPNVSSDHLLLYFEKEGEDVQDVSVNEEEQTAIINFQDPRGIVILTEVLRFFVLYTVSDTYYICILNMYVFF